MGGAIWGEYSFGKYGKFFFGGFTAIEKKSSGGEVCDIGRVNMKTWGRHGIREIVEDGPYQFDKAYSKEGFAMWATLWSASLFLRPNEMACASLPMKKRISKGRLCHVICNNHRKKGDCD